ncbi:MAG: peptidoglycan recognition family protein [Phormidesmis sp.]
MTTMHRSWIVWLLSTFAFCVTVAAIIATGPSQNSHSQDARAQEDSEEEGVRLPQIEAPAASQTTGSQIISNQTTATSGTNSLSKPATQLNATQASTRQAANLGKANPNKINSSIRKSSQAALATPETAAPAQAQAVVGISYQPPEEVQLAHPSNYGQRYTHDANGNLVNNEYIVVLHETVGSASSALNTFQTNHPRDEDQVSYHTLIGLDGTIYYVVPPEQRAFGAGDSVFQSFLGEESVFTNAEFPSSVNNFSYHISLETPIDGQNNNSTYHSGYTESQYQSLAWLLARTNIPDDRITTHRTVDRSGSRIDPRSFEADRMFRLLRQYPSRQQPG